MEKEPGGGGANEALPIEPTLQRVPTSLSDRETEVPSKGRDLAVCGEWEKGVPAASGYERFLGYRRGSAPFRTAHSGACPLVPTHGSARPIRPGGRGESRSSGPAPL